MPRHRAIAILAFVAVLISAGSVGSQDPYQARSEAESAEFATPITALPGTPSAGAGSSVTEPAAVHAPLSITPTAIDPAPYAPAIPAPVAAPTPAKISSAAPSPLLAPAVALASAREVTRAAIAVDRVATAPTTALLRTEDEIPLFDSAERRMFATVPDEIEGYFDLFMYVSKSNRGPFAQRMFVFQRDGDGKIIPYAEWTVSTGREKVELHHERKVRTTTPEGMFALDPDRFYKRYWSKTWDGAPMHYAMFYDLMNNGRQSGLAIHAAIGDDKIRRLGKRDSAGCIRLSPKHAKELFYKIRNTTQGRVPAFALNEKGSTDRWGAVVRDETGVMMLQDGYRAVLLVENYDGRDEIMGPVVAYTN
jgi:lipoprotein-anchoring transpeptidase ErfK/SrfK